MDLYARLIPTYLFYILIVTGKVHDYATITLGKKLYLISYCCTLTAKCERSMVRLNCAPSFCAFWHDYKIFRLIGGNATYHF